MGVYVKVFKQLMKIEQEAKRLVGGSAAEGLASIDIHILHALYVQDGQHPSTLAQAVGRAATSFTPLLDKLERCGLIERQPDKTDRRAVHIHLTDKGWALRGKIENVVAAIDEQFAGQVESI
jgi:DNA-binding MarR family transcriptional regulator